MGIAVIFFILFCTYLFIAIATIKRYKEGTSFLGIGLFILYNLSFLPFTFALMIHSSPYYKAIDPIDLEGYSPFGEKHVISLLVYFILFNIAALLVWIKGRKLPPIALVLSLVFLFIGVVLSAAVIAQISIHDVSSLGIYNTVNEGIFYFLGTPLLMLLIAMALLVKVIKEKKENARGKIYKNKFLNACNSFLANRLDETWWAFILLIPVFALVTIILTLFGQDVDSLSKVFTETTTWNFSQKQHPPILDHTGHYLCTVAAKGSPNIVKPLYLGERNTTTIIVNRQLQIANAFEEMIQDISPKSHYYLRTFYDKYGYNLSLTINSKIGSNITYIVMKPLEWLFLFFLYLFCEAPEAKISKQYRRNN